MQYTVLEISPFEFCFQAYSITEDKWEINTLIEEKSGQKYITQFLHIDRFPAPILRTGRQADSQELQIAKSNHQTLLYIFRTHIIIHAKPPS